MKGDTLILALADLSGSMTGEPISKMNVQLTELLSELQMMQDHAEGTIYFCLAGFMKGAVFRGTDAGLPVEWSAASSGGP